MAYFVYKFLTGNLGEGLGKKFEGNRIEYYITTEGPEPKQLLKHYIVSR